MDWTWTSDDDRGLLDYVALVVIGIALIACALLSLGALVAPFIVSRAYGEYNFVVSIAAAGIGALVAVYLLMTWVPVARIQTGVALIVLIGGMAWLAVDRGIPATFGALQGRQQTVSFLVTGTASGGRRSCAGVYVSNPDYIDSKICGVRAEKGMHVMVAGRASWFGLAYKATKVTP